MGQMEGAPDWPERVLQGTLEEGEHLHPGRTPAFAFRVQSATATPIEAGGWTQRCRDLLNLESSVLLDPSGIQLPKGHFGCLLSCDLEHSELTFWLNAPRGGWERVGPREKRREKLYCSLLRAFNMQMNILNNIGSDAQRYFATSPQGNSWIKESLKCILRIVC